MIHRREVDAPLVALSFDDGPSLWTEKILDLLAATGVRATFFVCGVAIDGRRTRCGGASPRGTRWQTTRTPIRSCASSIAPRSSVELDARERRDRVRHRCAVRCTSGRRTSNRARTSRPSLRISASVSRSAQTPVDYRLGSGAGRANARGDHRESPGRFDHRPPTTRCRRRIARRRFPHATRPFGPSGCCCRGSRSAGSGR